MSSEKKHSVFGASTAKRWMNCPGSIALIEKAPPQTESEHAQAGTKAHELMEAWVKQSKVGPALSARWDKEYGSDTVSAVSVLVNYVRENTPKGAELVVEERVEPGFHPRAFGTVDVGIVELFGTLHVIDYKHGQGVVVDVVEDGKPNEQAVYYALGLAREYDFNFSEVKITIVQPRAWHEKGPIRSHTMSVEELCEWSDRFALAAKKCEEKNAPLRAGSWCRFCPAEIICPEKAKASFADLKSDFSMLAPEEKALPDPRDMRPEALSAALKAAELLDSWISSVRAYAFDYLKRGGELETHKLVPKKAQRKWVDAEKATKEAKRLFGEKAFTEPELLSPAQLEKLGKKYAEFVEERVAAVSSGLTLAPIEDKRQASSQLALDFAGVSREEKSARLKSEKTEKARNGRASARGKKGGSLPSRLH